ncbi:MAG: PaaX [Pseudomonadota bacterium]
MTDRTRFEAALQSPMSAKQLVLSLFAGLDDSRLPISSLIAGAEAFDIEASAVRVAVNRLTKESVLHPTERGVYSIGEAGRVLYDATLAWRKIGDRVRDWDGGWFGIHTAHLGRTDRKAVRARDRALRLSGFATLEDGLWIRPDNLSTTLLELSADLTALGLSRRAVLFRSDELIHDQSMTIPELWNRKDLEANYRAGLAQISASEARLNALPPAKAAREVLQTGSAVIDVLTHDPLLPDALVDTGLRGDLLQAMLSYDVKGKAVWATFFETIDASQISATA